MIKVSVIVPIYNVEHYLEECLNSIVGQSLKELEIICVDDGSTDASLEIVRKYEKKDSRIKVLTGPNGGYGKAMNKGLETVKGKYIGIVEPDDMVSLNMFEFLFICAEKNNLDICKADFYRFYKRKNGDIEYKYVKLSKQPADYNIVIDPSSNKRAFEFVINTWSGIYLRSMLEEYNIRHNESPGASYQDNGFFFQTFTRAKRVMICDVGLYKCRRDNPNSSCYRKDNAYAANREFGFIEDILKRDSLWNEYKYYFSRLKFLTYIFTLNRIDDEYKKEYAESMAIELKEAILAKEVDMMLFGEKDAGILKAIVEDAQKYVEEMNILKKKTPDEQQLLLTELNRIKNSVSYKIGLKITYLPRKVYHMIEGK